MKQSITFSDFIDAFRAHDRYGSFGYNGLRIIFNYLEQYEQDCNTEIELDVIAICCDYSEDTWQDISSNYSIDLSDCKDEDEKIEAVREYLEENMFLVGESYTGAFVYQVF